MRLQVLGLCRFSLLVTDGFRKMPEPLEERRARLYDPARLNERMTWFEHVFLPSIRAQTDRDFLMIVATGEDLPEPWRGRLSALAASVPEIELLFLPPAGHSEQTREALLARMDSRADVVAQFRQDDDDAVALDFVGRVRQDFTDRLQPLFDLQSLLMLDYARGFALTGFGGAVSLYPMISQSWALAQVIYMRPDHSRTAMDYPHKRIFRHMPTVSLNDRAMYLRGIHDWNDSGVRDFALPKPVPEDRASEWVRNRFGIDLDRLSTALNAIAK